MLIDGYPSYLYVIECFVGVYRYDVTDLEDDYIHLTNTCRGAEDIDFDENIFVRVSVLSPSEYFVYNYPHVLYFVNPAHR